MFPLLLEFMASFFFLFLFLFLTTISAADIPVYHTTHPTTTTTSPLDTILALAHNDAARLRFLTSKISAPSVVPVASGQQILQNPSYVIRAALGSPAQPLLLALDTGADVTWAPCSPCNSCQSSTLFSPTNSTSYSPLKCTSPFCPLFQASTSPCSSNPNSGSCSYTQPFADTTFQATLSQDSLHLALDAIPNYAFGCVNSFSAPSSNVPKQGLLGLGRGTMSLLSQAGNLYKGVFSYCLPSFKSYYFSGSLRLGPVGQPRGVRYTPLLTNPHRPSLYYVNVTGVSVGRTRVSVPADGTSFGFDPLTGAGTVIDSGTVISRFTTQVYSALRDEFRRQVGSPTGYSSLGAFDTCFSTDEVQWRVPAVTIHMDGVDLTLPMENTLIHSSATPIACLAMAEAPQNVNVLMNVIANLQQQNIRVVVDTASSRVGFARESCN